MFDGLEPTERARSATVSSSNLHRPKRSFEIPSRLSSVTCLEENTNQSRKDSGIRSNSRKSSIQQVGNSSAIFFSFSNNTPLLRVNLTPSTKQKYIQIF